MLGWLNFIVLTLTLVVLIFYAFDTHRIANQTVEANLKPVILRSGVILGWDDLLLKTQNKPSSDGHYLEFTNHKNLAQNITGYLVISKKKYPIFFGNEISSFEVKDSAAAGKGMSIFPSWGWLPPGGKVYGFTNGSTDDVNEENKIYLEYLDIEGNKYFTKEVGETGFIQITGRL